jgi:ureidoglycolate lyase
VGTLEAFYVNGQQSITLKAGVWHHGLLALNAGNFVVLERSAAHVDCDVVQLTEPVQIVLP